MTKVQGLVKVKKYYTLVIKSENGDVKRVYREADDDDHADIKATTTTTTRNSFEQYNETI